MKKIIENIDYNQLITNKIKQATKFDEVDTVAFGLETDDDKIVKVYVKHDKSERFESMLAKLLGEIDSIEDALAQVSKEDSDMIVDVEWPAGDEESNEESLDMIDDDFDEDGSDSMEKSILKNKNEIDSKDHKIKQESLSIGKQFAQKLTEGKSKMKVNGTYEKLVLGALIELGMSEDILSSPGIKASVLSAIKSRAAVLQDDSLGTNALRAFVKKTELKESIQLNESVNRETVGDFLKLFIAILDKDYPNFDKNPNSYANKLLNSTFMNSFLDRTPQNSYAKLNSISSQFSTLYSKLIDVAEKIKKSKEGNSSLIPESTKRKISEGKSIETPDWDIQKLNGVYVLMCDSIAFEFDDESVEQILKGRIGKSITSLKTVDGKNVLFVPSKDGGSFKKHREDTYYKVSSSELNNIGKLLSKKEEINESKTSVQSDYDRIINLDYWEILDAADWFDDLTKRDIFLDMHDEIIHKKKLSHLVDYFMKAQHGNNWPSKVNIKNINEELDHNQADELDKILKKYGMQEGGLDKGMDHYKLYVEFNDESAFVKKYPKLLGDSSFHSVLKKLGFEYQSDDHKSALSKNRDNFTMKLKKI